MPTPSRTSPLWNTRPTQPRAAAGAPASQGNPCALDCRRKACSSAPGAPSTLQGSPCQARRASPGRSARAVCLATGGAGAGATPRAAVHVLVSSRQQRRCAAERQGVPQRRCPRRCEAQQPRVER